MKNLLKRLLRSRYPYRPLITIELSRSRLLHNIAQFRKLTKHGRLIPALKSNAYGHGIFEIATILEEERTNDSEFGKAIPFFAVDSYFEAISLRSKGFKTPLLIIAYTRPEDIMNSNLKNIAFFVSSLQTLQEIKSTSGRINIHLKIDTGMHRQGIFENEIEQAISIIKSNKNIILEGLSSHLADADNTDSTITEKQIIKWNKIVKDFEQNFGQIEYVHLSNSHGHKYADKITANIARLGIGLYGLAQGIDNIAGLLPVLQMKTIITSMKQISSGDSVGYNHTFTADRDMKIATIPVGYYEGLDRLLSNCGFVQVGPEKILCPIIGKISMNISTIDVSKLPNPKVNDEVVVISHNSDDPNSINNITKLAKTIEYEISVHIPQHLKRVVVK